MARERNVPARNDGTAVVALLDRLSPSRRELVSGGLSRPPRSVAPETAVG